jgi:hypothetical protein
VSEIDTSIELNADFSQRVVVRPDDYSWEASPMPGVERMNQTVPFPLMNIQAARRFLFWKESLEMSMARIQREHISEIQLAQSISLS